MKSKLLITVALAGLLGSSLYAYDGNNMPGLQKGFMPPQAPNCMDRPMMKDGKPFKDGGILSLLRELNLTPEQMADVDKAVKDSMKKRVKISDAFSKDGFDKDKYIKLMKQQRDNMLESKAELISKVYKILTSKQKEQLKVLMDLREDRVPPMMNKRMNFDQNCYGRR